MASLELQWLGGYCSLPCLVSFLLLLSLLYCLRTWQSTRRQRLPPGPPSLPIIGHLHLLGPLPHQSLRLLSQAHGPLMLLRLGSVPLLVASSSSMAREILQSHDDAFASRPRTSASVHLLFDGKGIAFAPYGPYWRSARQLCNAGIFSAKGNQAFQATRAQEVAIVMRSVFEDSLAGKQTEVRSRVVPAFINVMFRQVFGTRCTETVTFCPDPSEAIRSCLMEMFQLLGAFNIGDFIPVMQWMDLQGYVKRMKVVAEKLQSLLDGIVSARRGLSTGKPGEPGDLLSVLLSASQDSERAVPITNDGIMAILQDMFLAGTETPGAAVEWALAEMLRNPTAMKKLREELDAVVGRERFVQESDVEQLPYLKAVVKETFRIHPVGPFLLPRESIKPCQVAGYEIPDKTLVLVNAWALGRDANEWEKPLDFRPERFIESSVDVRGQHFHFLPFGSGRRMCPGLFVGLRNVQVMLANLVQGFDWRLPFSCKDGLIDMSERYALTLQMASPLVAQATPRLSPHLYVAAAAAFSQ